MSPTTVPRPMSIASSGLVGMDGRVTMLRLPPYHEIPKYIEYFYEGSVTVVRGVVLVPSHKIEWIERLLNSGYVLEDPAEAPTAELLALNTASMEANGGYEFLASLGYAYDGPEPVEEPVGGNVDPDERSEPVDEPDAESNEDPSDD